MGRAFSFFLTDLDSISSSTFSSGLSLKMSSSVSASPQHSFPCSELTEEEPTDDVDKNLDGSEDLDFVDVERL